MIQNMLQYVRLVSCLCVTHSHLLLMVEETRRQNTLRAKVTRPMTCTLFLTHDSHLCVEKCHKCVSENAFFSQMYSLSCSSNLKSDATVYCPYPEINKYTIELESNICNTSSF